MSWHSRQGVKQNFKNCQTWSARVPRSLTMSFPSNKREASQKLKPFHSQRLAQRGHNQHQTLLSSSCLPLPADLKQPGLCRQKPPGKLLFHFGIFPTARLACCFISLCPFSPSICLKMPRYPVQFDKGHVVSNWGCQETKGSPLTNSTCALWTRIRKWEVVLQN